MKEIHFQEPGVLPCDPNDMAADLGMHGALVLRGFESAARVRQLREEAVRLVEEDSARCGPDHQLHGLVYALMTRSRVFLDWMTNPAALAIFRAVLGHGCIVHHYCVSAMAPGKESYAAEVHTDVPPSRFIENYITNVGILLAMDPFTEQNGAFQLMPSSCRRLELPSDAEFGREHEAPEMAPGDAVVFNARCAHRGGQNRSDTWRVGLALQSCRAYMRQLFDYPRMMPADLRAGLTEEQEQFLGCWVRMPASLDEYTMPPETRPYRPGQE